MYPYHIAIKDSFRERGWKRKKTNCDLLRKEIYIVLKSILKLKEELKK